MIMLRACSINAAGSVIPPFVVWGGKTHRESYYKKDDNRDATFAVCDSGYMDDELGAVYISTFRTACPNRAAPHPYRGWPLIPYLLACSSVRP